MTYLSRRRFGNGEMLSAAAVSESAPQAAGAQPAQSPADQNQSISAMAAANHRSQKPSLSRISPNDECGREIAWHSFVGENRFTAQLIRKEPPPMTTSLKVIEDYPSGDGTPLAETFAHVYAILMALEVLKQFLEGQQATVLANQFMHYVQNGIKGTVAPDVMVIFGVKPGGRDSYVIEKEGAVPSVVFEMTSPGTKAEDKGNKKNLYARLGVQEYWLFDPKGEWIKDKLDGYRLITVEEDGILVNHYEQITDGTSQPLGLRLVVEGDLIGFYRLDNGQKLLIPSELAAELRRTSLMLEQERQRADQAEERAREADQQAAALRERLRALGFDPDEL